LFTHYLIKPGAPAYLWALGIAGDFLLFGGALFLVLNLVPNRFRKVLIAAATFLAGLIYSIEYFVPGGKDGRNFMTGVTEQLEQTMTVVFAFTLGLGIYSLLRFHGNNLMRKRQGWFYNLTFFVAFFTMLVLGLWHDASSSKAVTNTYQMLYDSTVVALSATMFSSIGFYIISAAYRAFRIRSGEATLMLVAAFIVMLGQVSIGAFITSGIPVDSFWSFFRLENLSYWILRGPNMAAQRGMSFGIEVGALAMALRIWLSLERGSFFDSEV
jgi:hypothetical protein